MHKYLLNEASFTLKLSTEGPLLVKAAGSTLDATRPDMEFVRTRKGGREVVYIPGSSLKGVVRSHAERILRTLDLEACDPFEESEKKNRCRNLDRLPDEGGARAPGGGADPARPKQKDGDFAYRHSCPACRIFGSTSLAARIAFSDALPEDLEKGQKTSTRMGVAIDRVLGSVAVGPFELEVADELSFKVSFRLWNFELWHLALLGLVVRDLGAGRVPVGFGKSRGLGHVRGGLERLELRTLCPGGLALEGSELTVLGAGKLAPEKEVPGYGMDPANDQVSFRLDAPPSLEDDLLESMVVLDRKQATALFRACMDKPWTAFRENPANRPRGGA